MNEDKFVQKGLNNKAKKDYRANKLNDILNSIDEIEFIKDWYGIDDKRPLTTQEIMDKYHIEDGRYLFMVLDKFNLERRTTKRSNEIIGMKRTEAKLNRITQILSKDELNDLYKDHTGAEIMRMYNLTDKEFESLLKHYGIQKHSASDSVRLTQANMSKERKKEISDKRQASITPEKEVERRKKISNTLMNMDPEEKRLIYLKASEKNKSRTPEEKRLSKEKEWATKIERGTMWSSSFERRFKTLLDEKFGEDDIEIEYSKDPRYPWHCDFYIKSLDLFIELNLHPSHWGYYIDKVPFDPNNKDHVLWTEISGKDTNIWAKSDYNKIQTARKNHLNYLAVYDYKFISNDEDIVSSLMKVRGVVILAA